MDSECIPCGLPTVTSPPKGQASEYEKKIFPYIRFPVACHREYQLPVSLDSRSHENEIFMQDSGLNPKS